MVSKVTPAPFRYFSIGKKELHYFDLQYHRSLRYYASHFAKANNQVKNEIIPSCAILTIFVLHNRFDWTRFLIGEKIFSGNTTPIPKELREILTEMYANDIDALYQRFGKKVAAWRISELSKRAES